MMNLRNLIALSLAIWAFPFMVWAEPQRLECNIKFGEFDDVYTIEIDTEKNLVNSTYHAASTKDKSITLDYKTSSSAIIYDEKVIYKANTHSLDYTYEINRNTLEIIRYINDANEAEVGRGSCNILKASGKKL